MVLLVLTVWPSIVRAQKPENNWDNLNKLRVGQEIQIVDMNLKRHIGTFLSYSDGAISIRTKQGDHGFPREKVFRVSSRERSRRIRNALIGAAIGAGTGLAVGALADRSFTESGEENTVKKILIPIGAAAGAGIGSAFASYETVFRAAKRASL